MAVDLTKLIDFDLLQRYDTKLKAWTEKKIVDSHEVIFTTKNSLPATGSMNLLYVTEDSILLWDGSEYIKVGGQGTGTTFIPSIDANGDLTWTNDGGLTNPDPVNVRGPAGKDGLDGKSAYDIAVENGFTGDEEAWLESLKGVDGKDGNQGEDGKSAYELAVDNGFEGTEAEWLESLKGEDGTVGEDGKSAYDLAVDAGFIGSESDWLESLKGKDGTNGASFTIKGLYPTYDDLIDAHPIGEAGDAYAVGNSDYNEIYNWSVDNLEWENLGSLEGPQGPKGEDSTVPGPEGKSAYQVAVDNGFDGTEEEWLESLRNSDELITIKDTTFTNISQLEGINLPCCLHLIDSILGGSFNDDIVYVQDADGILRVFTMDNVLYEIDVNQDGELLISNIINLQNAISKIPNVIKRCVWFYEAGDDISLFAQGNTNVASFTEFIGHKPTISSNNVGIILVDNKLYWTKFNITAINDSTGGAYQTFTRDPILIGPVDSASSELITIKNTEITNISQLPIGGNNAYCVHLVNCIFNYQFTDDIIHIEHRAANMRVVVHTLDGVEFSLTYDGDGNFDFDNASSTSIATERYVYETYYDKDTVDYKLENIELTPGPKGDDGSSIVSMRLDENLHLISTLSNGVEIDAGKIDIDGLTIEKTEVIDVKLVTQEITFDGETTEFDLPADSKTLMVYVNGLCLEENLDYTINEGAITFNEVFNETDKGILRWFDKNSADSSETLWATENDIDSMFG